MQLLQKQIRDINPVCEILLSANGEMDYSFLRKDLTIYQWAESEETTNSVENKPKSIFLEYSDTVEKSKLDRFLQSLSPDIYRVKGFCRLEKEGWTQIDVVEALIDYKPSEEFEKSQLVFISKVGPAIIKKIFSSWQENVGTKMTLKN